MGETQLTTYEKCGLELPQDVKQRFNAECLITRQQQRINANDQVRVCYSYGTIIAQTWSWLRKALNVPGVCPPITIDWRVNEAPVIRTKDGSPYTWMVGIFNQCGPLLQTQKTIPEFHPTDYEIRIFHQNILREIRSIFGKHPLEIGIVLTLTHTIIHEICHYIRLLSFYAATSGDTEESWRQLLDYISAKSGTVQEEYDNEAQTIRLMTRMWITEPYHLTDLGEVTLTGPYDDWRRRFDPEYAIASAYLQNMTLGNEETMRDLSQEERAQAHHNFDLISELSKVYRDEARPFAMVD